LTGVDVSDHNDVVDWRKVKATGRVFAFARISDGLPTADEQFAANWKGMKAAGLVRGAYQFFRARHGDDRQADLLVRTIADAGGLKPGDLPPVLDLEIDDDQPASKVVSRAKAWLARVESRLGVRPIVYTGNNMAETIGNAFKDYTLWIAHYEVECPRIPAAWTTWAFWQNDEHGRVSGVPGDADTDFFNGTRSQLNTLTIPPAGQLSPSEKPARAEQPDDAASEVEGTAVMGDGQRRAR
jgi:lysozyme